MGLSSDMAKTAPKSSTARSVSGLDRKVGQKLRLLRQAAGLSQADLGELVGVTYQQVQKYERGVNRISAVRLNEFAAALNAPVLVFFDQPADLKPVRPPAEQAAEVADLFSMIDDSRVRMRVLALIRLLGQRQSC